jgi:hypothetical protein
MMYQGKFVVAVKVNGEVLREFGDTVKIPFGAEYSLYLKNLNVHRAVVNISIDGKDVTEGGVIVNANSAVDLERFLGDSLTEGRKFKFIERTSDIEDYRGIKAEDGIIRVQFQYELPYQFNNSVLRSVSLTNMSGSLGSEVKCSSISSDTTKAAVFTASTGDSQATLNANYSANAALNTVVNDAGITVEGSESKQSFKYASVGMLGESNVIVLRMVGNTGAAQVVEPVTVKTKKRCSNCGRTYAMNYSYCSHDGSYLKDLV